MPGVDGEQLALDVRTEVVDPGDARDIGFLTVEGPALDRPLGEVLDRDVEPGVLGLHRHDPVDGGVGEQRLVLEIVAGVVRADLLLQQVGRVDRVLAGHHRQAGRGGRAGRDPGGDVRGDEAQDVRAHRRGDDVRLGDLRSQNIGVLRRVDGREAVDDGGGGVLADGADLVGVRLLQSGDQGVGDVREHQLVAGLVQQQADEAAADVPCADVDCLHRLHRLHRLHSFSSPRIARISSTVVACSRRSTWAGSEKVMATFCSSSRCSLPTPAMPMTNVVELPFQSMPSG